MNQMTEDFRNNIAQLFIQSLEQEELSWKKSWTAINLLPQNAVSGTNYKGINRFYLMFLCQKNKWEDPRFATFKQIQDKGWHLQRGSKGIKVEYWMPYDQEQKKVISWKEANLSDKKIGVIPKYYTVFNAKDIEGIPPIEMPEKKDINPDEILATICKNMNIEIVNDGGGRAFYRPSEDKIHLPKAGYFNSDYAYNSVAMHELSHATGAPHRLNRNIQNLFGSEDYAFEELIAEISSVFMSKDLSSCMEPYEMDNHKAYVQGWISHIKEKPDILIQAIKEANKAADYLEEAAELVPKRTQDKEDILEVDAEKIVAIPMNKQEYLNQKGVGSPFGPYQDDKLIGHTKVLNQKSTEKDFWNTSEEYWIKREKVQEEYKELVEEGIVREKSIIENTIDRASGNPENESVQAARRMLDKRGIDLNDALNNQNPIEMRKKEILRDLTSNDFKPTKRLIHNILELDKNTGNKNTLADIVKIYKGKEVPLDEEAKDLVQQIVKECKAQEMELCR